MTAALHGYAGSVVALHDGEAYAFELVKSDFSGVYFDLKVSQLMVAGNTESDAILGVMGQLEERGSITWRRI